MHIILNIVPAGSLSNALANTGLNIALTLIALALVIGAGIFAHRKQLVKPFAAAGAVIALTLANLAGGGAVSEVNALVTPAKTPELTITLEQGASATASDNAILNIAHASAWRLLASVDQEIAGLTLKINDKAIGADTVIDEGDEAISEDRSYPVSASASSDIALGKYEVEITFDTVDKVQGGGDEPGGGENEPTVPTIAGNLSMTNGSETGDWSNTLTNWAGGDLIITDEHLATKFTTASAITVGGEDCTTTADDVDTPAKNVITSVGISKIGCVLPPLAQGSHDVKVDNVKVGTITYAKTPFTEKANIKQGEVQILTDTRTDGAGVSNKEYRVKCFSTDCWMIDNLVYTPTVGSGQDFETSNIDIINDATVTTSTGDKAQVVTLSHTSNSKPRLTEYGNLYNFPAVQSNKLLPTGWHVPSGNGSEMSALNSAMTSAATTNPVYSATAWKNYSNPTWAWSPTDERASGYNDAPWQGVYSGYYHSNDSGLFYQGIFGFYWSSTAYDGGNAYELGFNGLGYVNCGLDSTDASFAFAVRGML